MRKVNYRSDFDFILRLSDCRGDDIGFPDYDWEARFYTRGNRANAYVASCKGGECVNCFNDGGRVHVVVNSPRLGLGELFVDFKASLPNLIYPDEHQDEMAPLSTGIELVRGAAPCPCSAEVELVLPYVRFRYEDFTPEQIEELKRPATEAAQRADNFVQTASEAETIRVANEESRVRKESDRVEREQLRESAEEARKAAETKRAEAEEARELAETKRATDFASWETEIDSKADRGTVFEVVATEQIAEEANPDCYQQFVCETLAGAERISRGDILKISLPSGMQLEVTVSETYYNHGVGRLSGFTTTPEQPVFVSLDTFHANCTLSIIYIAMVGQLSAVTGEPTEGAIEALEPTLITEALRKVPQVLTPQEQAQVKANLAISKMELFCDLFNAAAGSDGYARLTEGVFDCELNKLKLTYEEAVAVCSAGRLTVDVSYGFYATTKIRTNLPPYPGAWGYPVGNLTFTSSRIEVANVCNGINAATLTFAQCPKLREIIGPIAVSGNVPTAFQSSPKLEAIDIRLSSTESTSLTLTDCPLINLPSFQNMINKKNGDFTTVITIHPDVYAKLTDESNAEWHKVLTDAAARNITFATI